MTIAPTSQLPVTPSPPTADEADLVSRLRAGDDVAYETLVRQYGGRMLASARRYFPDGDDADDAVQDAFISAFQAIGHFAGTSRLATWLHRIVVNACLMKLRSQRRHQANSIEDLLPQFAADGHHAQTVARWTCPVASCEAGEGRHVVRNAIESLPEAYREVVLLRDIEELDTDETARVLGLSAGNVKTRLHRARQALRTQLEVLISADVVLRTWRQPSTHAIGAKDGLIPPKPESPG